MKRKKEKIHSPSKGTKGLNSKKSTSSKRQTNSSNELQKTFKDVYSHQDKKGLLNYLQTR